MGKRSAVVELFLGNMGSMQRELRPSTQREDQLTMETKLEQVAVKAVKQLPKSVVREIRTPRSVGAGGGRPPPRPGGRGEILVPTATIQGGASMGRPSKFLIWPGRVAAPPWQAAERALSGASAPPDYSTALA
jgi:hypothetical protein